jgi:hypothetical protein
MRDPRDLHGGALNALAERGHRLDAYSGDVDHSFRPHRDHPFRFIAITPRLSAGSNCTLPA